MDKGEANLISKKRRMDSDDIPNPEGVQSAHRLYFKGLVSNETAAKNTAKAGFGVAICDQTDKLLCEVKETLSVAEIKRKGVEIMALIRGLSECLNLGISSVVIYCDDHRIYQFITGRSVPKPRQSNLVQPLEEVLRLREKIAFSEAVMVARNDIKFAYKLAREAIDSQTDVKGETCIICLEETEAERFFVIDKCLHRYCFSCVKQYVELKLRDGILPKCPNDGCNSELTLESCNKLLTLKLIEMWKRKMKEDSIPVSERIYCPYPNCSVLMSKTELDETDQSNNVRACLKCCGLFCMDCKVPSHSEMSCAEFKKLYPGPLADDEMTKLVNDNKWRQCIKCRHLIELSQGCNHMTCRCGYQFCYICGAEWKKGQQACPTGCPPSDRADYDDDSDDDDDDSHDCEEDMCNCYYDEEGGRWQNYEDYIDHQAANYDWTAEELNYPLSGRIIIEEDAYDDAYDDCGCNCGGLTDSDGEGDFLNYYMDYYGL